MVKSHLIYDYYGSDDMRTVRSAEYFRMQELSETSIEVTLVEAGKEECKPYHAFSGTHEVYLIHFVLSGGGFYSANGNTWSLSSGQMFLIYPDEEVIYCADKNNPWTYAWIGFQGLGTNNILKSCGFSKNNLVLPTPPFEEYIGVIDELLDHNSMAFSHSLFRESSLFKLFAILAQYHTQSSVQETLEQRSDNSYVNYAIEYINKMYTQNIGVSDIADSIGISRSHLNQIFQKELNISVQNFLIDFRMHKSANLLVSTSMSIKEIANHVGYNDQLVFSKAFKKKFGMSPKSYRNYKNETAPEKIGL